MGFADNMLSRIANAQRMTGRDRLVTGKHRIALVNFGERKSNKGNEMRLQADFEVIQSTVYQPGAKCSVAFFVNRSNFPEYEQDRARQFIDACAASVTDLSDDKRSTMAFGEIMFAGYARGLVIDVTVTGDMNEDGSPKKGKKGNQYTSESWSPVVQTRAEIGKLGVELTQRHGAPGQEGQAQQQQQQQQSQPVQQQTVQQNQPQGWGQPQQQTQQQPNSLLHPQGGGGNQGGGWGQGGNQGGVW